MKFFPNASRSLSVFTGLALLAASASAGELTADCDGWSIKGSWPKAALVSADVTLYLKVDGQLIMVDMASDSTLVPEGGGPICIGTSWSLELDGVYCVQSCETVEELGEGGRTLTYKMTFGPFTCEHPDDSQLVPTGYECDDFVNGTAPDVEFTVNPSGNIAPGALFFYSRFAASGDSNIVVTTSTIPDEVADSRLRGSKVFIVQNGLCRNISQQEGVTISLEGNVATIFVAESWVAASDDGRLIVRGEYNTARGAAGDTHVFTTDLNGTQVAYEEITVIPQ